ncbi:MAG: hypothetical protein D3X82_11950 [Candidatus Leucobacter sulfamidivorax]|nr:hypothetical protein [Candidatus Leucobacter sulfamidivorax]
MPQTRTPRPDPVSSVVSASASVPASSGDAVAAVVCAAPDWAASASTAAGTADASRSRIRVATASSSARSWLAKSTMPGQAARVRSR